MRFLTHDSEVVYFLQDDVRKRRAFLDRIRAQEPDIDRGCIIRSSESDEVLIRENRAALSSKTLTRNQEEIVNVSRLGGQDVIGRGGFGEVRNVAVLHPFGICTVDTVLKIPIVVDHHCH